MFETFDQLLIAVIAIVGFGIACVRGTWRNN